MPNQGGDYGLFDAIYETVQRTDKRVEGVETKLAKVDNDVHRLSGEVEVLRDVVCRPGEVTGTFLGVGGKKWKAVSAFVAAVGIGVGAVLGWMEITQ
jgi:hypothetical protein